MGKSIATGKPYDVGYAKPPKDGQFKTGESGNPNGRPKAATSLEGQVSAVLKQKVTVRVGGKKRRMTKGELLVNQAYAEATSSTAATARVAMTRLLFKHQVDQVEQQSGGRTEEEWRAGHLEVNKILADWLEAGMTSPPEAVQKAVEDLINLDADDFDMGRARIRANLIYATGAARKPED